ncbi:4331_t:CDS:2 [Dentiscutata erythropus]|uniref:4331_t:CDS:1 n=1 Tax=Dentiscutata erythropus TaxID=1348616 RepID=A0A9N9CJZ4_9GLOM|nr:4331_t:CDS:2 [Dentiscutata erythropus]
MFLSLKTVRVMTKKVEAEDYDKLSKEDNIQCFLESLFDDPYEWICQLSFIF